jgi:hypothetical protein
MLSRLKVLEGYRKPPVFTNRKEGRTRKTGGRGNDQSESGHGFLKKAYLAAQVFHFGRS